MRAGNKFERLLYKPEENLEAPLKEERVKISSRFVKFFVAGSALEAVRLLAFHFLFVRGSSLSSNFYSQLASLILSFPFLAKFIWPDRGGVTVVRLLRYVLVWVIALAIKLPLLELMIEPCQRAQVVIDLWRLANLPSPAAWLPFYRLVFGCANLVTALMDLIVAVGLKYVLFDRLVFVVRVPKKEP